jgi:hypothetical protein
MADRGKALADELARHWLRLDGSEPVTDSTTLLKREDGLVPARFSERNRDFLRH